MFSTVLNLSRKVAQAGANLGQLQQHARRAAAESLMPAPVASRPAVNLARSAPPASIVAPAALAARAAVASAPSASSASTQHPSNLRGLLPALRSVLPAATYGYATCYAAGYLPNLAASSASSSLPLAPAGSGSEPVPMGSFGALGSLEASLEEPAPADVAAWRSMMAVHGFCLPSMQPGASWGAVASSGGSYRQQREELHPMFELLLL